jgi:hypothetical protein
MHLITTSLVGKKRKEIALEGLAAIINRVTCFVPVSGLTFYMHLVTPAVPYLLTGLAGYSMGRGK